MWTNWSGLATAHPRQTVAPRNVQDVVDTVVGAARFGLRVKMVGTGHSFTPIATTDGVMMRPDRLRGVTGIDRDAMTVTALAGTTLHELNLTLERLGLALHNMGDVDVQTLAGAVSTGTHGTGGDVAALAAQVVGLELVTGDGTVLRAGPEENADVLDVARVGLGALGVLVSLTFRVEPAFVLAADEGPLRWDAALATFEEQTAAHDHYEMYWFPHTDRLLAKRNDRVATPADPETRWRSWVEDELLANAAFGAVQRVGNLVPATVPGLANAAARALSGRRYSDSAHRVFTSVRRVRFREMEYAVPREAGMEALAELRRVIERHGFRVGFPVEVRSAPADDVPLSTASGRDSVYLACHVNARTDHHAFFAAAEQVLCGFDGRPHWGKLHTRTAADLASAYPRFGEFVTLRDKLDPGRVFANAYLERVLGA